MNTDCWGVVERKLREYTNPWFALARRKKLNRADFTVISNNCWAGSVYRYFGLPYLSPTAGLYFFASDYIKFVQICDIISIRNWNLFLQSILLMQMCYIVEMS